MCRHRSASDVLAKQRKLGAIKISQENTYIHTHCNIHVVTLLLLDVYLHNWQENPEPNKHPYWLNPGFRQKSQNFRKKLCQNGDVKSFKKHGRKSAWSFQNKSVGTRYDVVSVCSFVHFELNTHMECNERSAKYYERRCCCRHCLFEHLQFYFNSNFTLLPTLAVTTYAFTLHQSWLL